MAPRGLRNIRRELDVCAVLVSSAQHQKDSGLARSAVRRARAAWDEARQLVGTVEEQYSTALIEELDVFGARLSELERSLDRPEEERK